MSKESVQFILMARLSLAKPKTDLRAGDDAEASSSSPRETAPEQRVILHCGFCKRLTVHWLMGWDFRSVIYKCSTPKCVGNREISR